MQLYVGMDVDPVAHEKARARINEILHTKSSSSAPIPKTHIAVENFINVRSVLSEVDKNIKVSGIDGILMDLGMSSMQVFLSQSRSSLKYYSFITYGNLSNFSFSLQILFLNYLKERCPLVFIDGCLNNSILISFMKAQKMDKN